MLIFQALNRSGWFKPIKEGSSPGKVQRLTNKLSPQVLQVVDKAVWFVCTARNAIVVVACLLLAMAMDPLGHDCKTQPEECIFSLTGSIDGGLPALQPPPFSVELNVTSDTSGDHGWVLRYVGFSDMISTLGAAVVIIPVIAILESVAIAKAFGE